MPAEQLSSSGASLALLFEINKVGDKVIFSLPLHRAMEHIIQVANILLNKGSDKCGYESEVEFTESGTLNISLKMVGHH